MAKYTFNEKVFLVDCADRRTERQWNGNKTDSLSVTHGLVEFAIDIDGWYPRFSDKYSELDDNITDEDI